MSDHPTPEQIEAFKTAWHRADTEGRGGERVRDGLAAAMAIYPGRTIPADALVRELRHQAGMRFNRHGGQDPRGAAFWDVAAAIDEGRMLPPTPGLSLIPLSREEARVLEVNGALGTYWRVHDRVLRTSAHSPQSLACWVDEVTSVREVSVLTDDKVAVPREALDRLRGTYAEECAPRHGYLNGYGWRERVGNFLAALGGGDQA